MRLTNPLWYLAAFLIAIGSAMAAAAVAASAFDPVREATVTPVSERADASGKSLAVFTDIVQDDRDVTCQGRGRDKRRVEIPDKGVDITTESDGTRWHLIGLLEEGRNGLRVVCRPADKRIDNAAYGYATVDGYSSAITNGKGIVILGMTGGAGLGAYTFWCRRSARRESVDAA
ncbi:MAG: hypothetical protein JWP31_2094 [Aeromicrobium sp.]|nr:hypothetical protein [Aeromicrobium sp.]